MAVIYFGSPAVRQFLRVDTGSTLSWIQCFPCSHCFADHIYPKYWPEDSKTFSDAICESSPRNSTPRFTYSSGVCTYEAEYADGNQIRGTLSKETITIQTLDNGFEVVHDVYFGCNDQAVGEDYIGTGILGLGVGNYSLVEKLGSKFSLCFGRIRDQTPTNNLILGDGAMIQGQPTVINITEGHYMFQLESILVDDETETLDNPVQVYLDTGSMVSHLSSFLFELIVDKVRELLRYRFALVRLRSLLCFKMDYQEIPDDIDIGFIFAGGAELTMDIRSMFVPNGPPGTLCLAINKNAEQSDYVIIGAIAMQGYNLGYDRKAKSAYIQKRNCNI